MTTINLKDFYYWYTQDQLIEVSDEVAEVFKADARYEMAYQRRLSRHKAQYSLDCDDGIEYSACLHEPTPQELLERMETFLRLWNALNSLPEIQGRRIDAHIILGKSIKEIAEAEGVHAAHSCSEIHIPKSNPIIPAKQIAVIDKPICSKINWINHSFRSP